MGGKKVSAEVTIARGQDEACQVGISTLLEVRNGMLQEPQLIEIPPLPCIPQSCLLLSGPFWQHEQQVFIGEAAAKATLIQGKRKNAQRTAPHLSQP